MYVLEDLVKWSSTSRKNINANELLIIRLHWIENLKNFHFIMVKTEMFDVNKLFLGISYNYKPKNLISVIRLKST